MGIELVTPASTYPVSVAEAVRFCRAEDTGNDDLIGSFIAPATQAVEEFIGHSIMTQVWRLHRDAFADEMELPRGPVTAVAAVNYLDEAGAEQVLATSVYALDLVSSPPRVVRTAGASWPATDDAVNAVWIDYTAGYATLPAPIRHAVLATILQWFEDPAAAALSRGVKDALRAFRRVVI